MQDTARRLLAAQKIDTEIKGVREGLVALAPERVAIDAAIVAAGEVAARAKGIVEQEELEERQLESKMREQEALLAKLEGQMSQVTSSQAYEAMQHEIEHANEAKNDFETRALELMETIDSAKSQLASAQGKLEELETAAPDQIEGLASREATLNERLAELLERRAGQVAEIDPKILNRYDRVLAKRHPAVCVLGGSSCPECRIVLPRQVYSEIRRGEEIHGCSSCQRLLVPEHLVEG